MKYCAKCGHGNADDTAKCGLCGEALHFAPVQPMAGHSGPPATQEPQAMAKPGGETPAGGGPPTLWLVLNIILFALSCCFPSVAVLALEGAVFAGIGSSAHKKGDAHKRDSMATLSTVLFFTALGLAFLLMAAAAVFIIVFIAGLDQLGMTLWDYLREIQRAAGGFGR